MTGSGAATATTTGPYHPEAVVRVIGLRRDTYVEFTFSLGDPLLSVELILPFAAFAEFCAARQARLLPPEPEIADAIARAAWRLHRPDLPRALGCPAAAHTAH